MQIYESPHEQALPGTGRGDQAMFLFRGLLLSITDDVRTFFLPLSSDTASTSDRSRHGKSWVASKDMTTWDAGYPLTQGSGYYVHLDGTDEEFDVADDDIFTFGNGSIDYPFTVLALINPDTVSGVDTIIGKWDETTADPLREWIFQLNAGKIEALLLDESSNGQIGRTDGSALTAGTWYLVGVTYNGSRSNGGIRLYVNGVDQTDAVDNESGTYTAMENTATKPTIGFHIGASANEEFFDGKIATMVVIGKELSRDEMHNLVMPLRSHYDISI
jgi:hypothetical protein